MKPANSNKLRLLCLHGYRQDGDTFSKRIGALRKRLKAVAEFDFIDGSQIVVPGDESGIPGEEGRAGGRGWWFSREDDYFKATHYSDFQKGFQESVAVVEQKLCSDGPYDGLLGFSQGAALTTLVCALKDRGQLSPQATFRFVMLVSSFKSRCSQHDVHYSEPISTPSLHVIGDGDQVVDHSMSEELAAVFSDATILRHDGGHFVPATAPLAASYQNFLGRFSGPVVKGAAESPQGASGNTSSTTSNGGS